jgi:anaerobic selenocysteine-containing dehydrogenase
VCEDYGKDLVTGAAQEAVEYRSLNPDGKAMLKAAEYLPPHELPDPEHPFQLTTGRTLYHFHTRTKTGRAPQLNAAAPEVWVEVSAGDAARLDLAEGDLVEVSTPRGALRGRLRVTGLRPGVIFVPFHYGYWDTPAGAHPGPDTPGRAANETTVTDWDPVSKQPLFKTAAAALTLVARGAGEVSPAPTTTASAPIDPSGVPATAGGPAAHVSQTAGTATGGKEDR